jgi:hypothetical protein
MGFKQIFGNFAPVIENYEARSRRPTLLGGAPSAWFATDEFNFGKSMLSDLLGCSNILWNGSVMDQDKLFTVTQLRVPDIRARFRGSLPPSATEPAIAPLNISRSFNTRGSDPELNLDLRDMRHGTVSLGRTQFDLANRDGNTAVIIGTRGTTNTSLPSAVQGISIGVDATSLIFLHASAKPAFNREPYRLIWDFPDSADLLGWYEIVYEDGFVETIPIRYGVNIAEWSWAKRTSERGYCYGADPVPVGASEPDQITFFAFEWPNPRLGKVIRELRINGTSGFRGADPGFTNDYGPAIPSNAVILKAVSAVQKRSPDVPSKT